MLRYTPVVRVLGIDCGTEYTGYGVVEGERKQVPRTFLVDSRGKVRAIYREEGEDLEKVIEADLDASKNPVRPASAEGK